MRGSQQRKWTRWRRKKQMMKDLLKERKCIEVKVWRDTAVVGSWVIGWQLLRFEAPKRRVISSCPFCRIWEEDQSGKEWSRDACGVCGNKTTCLFNSSSCLESKTEEDDEAEMEQLSSVCPEGVSETRWALHVRGHVEKQKLQVFRNTCNCDKKRCRAHN